MKADADGILGEAKAIGKRLIAIVCIQENGGFRLDYIFGGEDDGGKGDKLTVTVPEKKPVLDSIMGVFPVAEIYEREIHDFFGVEFRGNSRLHDKLFLPDDYKGAPPLRKPALPGKEEGHTHTGKGGHEEEHKHA